MGQSRHRTSAGEARKPRQRPPDVIAVISYILVDPPYELARNLLKDLAAAGKFDKIKHPQFGSANGSIQMSDDFDETQDFAESME